jgi:hypothetical protein
MRLPNFNLKDCWIVQILETRNFLRGLFPLFLYKLFWGLVVLCLFPFGCAEYVTNNNKKND